MSVYLHQRLLSFGRISSTLLGEAFALSLVQRCSLIEALIGIDARLGIDVSECFEQDGDAALLSWRPDPRLLLDLPPGICDRFLAFPYRERGGVIEVATVSPLEEAVQCEFEWHLHRKVVLYRGSVQALLAAAGAAVDLSALGYHLSQPPPPVDEDPIPLVRRSSVFPPPRESMPAASDKTPPPPWSTPWSIDARLEDASDVEELSRLLSRALPAPVLVFELARGRLSLRAASGPGAYGEEVVSLVSDSALSRAVEQGSYRGPWFDSPIHGRFATSFPLGSAVRVERIGSPDTGLLVTVAGEMDVERATSVLRRGAAHWRRLKVID